MRILCLVLLLPSLCFATETINCHFDKFHQANHAAPEMSGYVSISQSLEIINGKTSDSTLRLDGKKRAANSSIWILLEPDGWDTYSTTYAGDFGEVLTVEHELGDNKTKLDGWFKSRLVSSNIHATQTQFGKCLIRRNT